jgi:cytochrome P450
MPAQERRIPREEMHWVTAFTEAHDVLRSPAFASSLHDGNSFPIVGDGALLTLHGGEHLERRRAEVPLVARTSLRRYEQDFVIPILRRGLEVDRLARGETVRVDVLRTIQTGLLTVSAQVLGIDGIHGPDEADVLRDIANRVGEGVTAEWTTRPVEDVIGEALRAKQEFVERFYAASYERRAKLVAAYRAGGIDRSELPVDLLSLLLEHYEQLDEDKLLRETLFFLTASANTTTHAAPHVLTELIAWNERNPERRDELADPEFLQRAVAEALRLHPQVPALLRRALEDTTTCTGRRVPRGEQLAIDMVAANRDVDVFGEDAGEFDPDRSTGRIPGYGLSFGAGQHACLGRPIALRTAPGRPEADDEPLGVLVRLLQEVFAYDVSLDPEDPPRHRDAVDVRYASFPVVLTRIDPASAG